MSNFKKKDFYHFYGTMKPHALRELTKGKWQTLREYLSTNIWGIHRKKCILLSLSFSLWEPETIRMLWRTMLLRSIRWFYSFLYIKTFTFYVQHKENSHGVRSSSPPPPIPPPTSRSLSYTHTPWELVLEYCVNYLMYA